MQQSQEDHDAAIERLVKRAGDLKQELVAFLHDRRVSAEFGDALERRYGTLVTGDETEFLAFCDTFLLQHRLRDGRTPVERFVRAHGELPRAERDMMRGWMQVVESVFEVHDFDGQAARVTNLVDELPYRVWSNMGPEGLAQFRPPAFASMRLVPVLDEWMISGPGIVLPPERAEPMLVLAAEVAVSHPEALCRNESHREVARTVQENSRKAFVAHFGSDLVVVPGPQLVQRLSEFWDASDTSAAARHDVPESLTSAGTVALIYDDEAGLGYYLEFGEVLAAFETDQPASRSIELVREYLEDPDLSPIPLIRCVRAHPERADAVFARALRRPKFSWQRDGEALLRRYKAPFLDAPPNFGVSVLSDRLRPYLKLPTS